MNRDGEKLMPDRRVSFGPGFSINQSLAWNDDDRQFAMVWQDERHAGQIGDDLDNFEVYFSRVGADGVRLPAPGTVEPEVRITNDGAPRASRRHRLGGRRVGRRLERESTRQLGDLLSPSRARRRGSEHRSAHHRGRREQPACDARLERAGVRHRVGRGARWRAGDLLDALREGRVPLERRVTTDGANSRYPSLLWTGSVWLLGWADFRDGNYELYYAVFDEAGARIGGDRRLTEAEGTRSTQVRHRRRRHRRALERQRNGDYEVYFTELLCSGRLDVTRRQVAGSGPRGPGERRRERPDGDGPPPGPVRRRLGGSAAAAVPFAGEPRHPIDRAFPRRSGGIDWSPICSNYNRAKEDVLR